MKNVGDGRPEFQVHILFQSEAGRGGVSFEQNEFRGIDDAWVKTAVLQRFLLPNGNRRDRFPGEYNDLSDTGRFVEFCQCVGADGACRTADQDYNSLGRSRTSGVVGRELLGTFGHKFIFSTVLSNFCETPIDVRSWVNFPRTETVGFW